MKLTALTFIAGLLLVASSCTNDEANDKPAHRYADLFVRYLEGENQLKATAIFLEGDTLSTARSIRLEKGIQFQGEPMEARTLPGGTIRYIVEKRAPQSGTYYFSFAEKPSMEVPMPVIDSFSVLGGQISRAEGLELYVEPVLGASESMVLFISDAQNKATTITLEGPITSQPIQVPAKEFQKLEPGPHELYIVKKREITQQGEQISTLANLEYYTLPVEFEVEE